MKPETSPTFRDALFTDGSLIVQCGFCKRIHFCLDEPGAEFSSLTETGPLSPVESEARFELAAAIRQFDPQSDSGINSAYEPDSLLLLLAKIQLPDAILGETPQAVVRSVFRCEEADAEALVSRQVELISAQKAIQDAVQAVAHVGQDTIACGRVDGLIAVEGCCDSRLAQYEKCFWISRRVIAEYFSIKANHAQDEAEEAREIAEKTASNEKV